MQPRIEQKLAVEPIQYIQLISWLADKCATELYPSRQVSSTYFDTADFAMFNDTVEGVVPRRKVRIRCYGPHPTGCSSIHNLEVKLTSEEGRRKNTRSLTGISESLWHGIPDEQYGWVFPCIEISYEREYFSVSGVRMTIDRGIRYRSAGSVSEFWVEDDQIAVEVKAPADTGLDWLSNEFPIPRIHFSKYERGVMRTRPPMAGPNV